MSVFSGYPPHNLYVYVCGRIAARYSVFIHRAFKFTLSPVSRLHFILFISISARLFVVKLCIDEHPSMLRSVLLLKGDMTLSRFLEEKEANKHKVDGSGNGGDDWWDDGVAEAVV